MRKARSVIFAAVKAAAWSRISLPYPVICRPMQPTREGQFEELCVFSPRREDFLALKRPGGGPD